MSIGSRSGIVLGAYGTSTRPRRRTSLRDEILLSYRIDNEVFDFHHDITSGPKSSFRDHRHPYYEIFLLLRGDDVAHVQDAEYPLAAGDLILMNRNESHWFQFLSDAPYERVKLQFKPEFVSDFQTQGHDLLGFFEHRRLGRFNHVSAETVRKARIDQIIRQMESDIRADSPDCSLLLRCEMVQLLIRLKEAFLGLHGTHSDSGFQDERITRILEYLRVHASERITLEGTASRFHMSKYYLCHLFKRCTGFSVLEYITHRRIVRVKELLARQRSVTEACYEAGFSDYSSFYREFRKAVRMSPKQFSRLL